MIEPGHQEAAALDCALATLLDLVLLAKQAHWNVAGPSFRSLHVALDELADLARHQADAVAERAATLGHAPDGRAAAIIRESTLPTLDVGPLRDNDVIRAFGTILETVGTCVQQALDAFDDDPVTFDLFTEVLAELEKQSWLFRAQSD
jgi:starvation-inducible DNA-binding protein